MLKQTILGTLALSAVGALTIACNSSAGEFADESDTAPAELGSDQRGCPSLVVRRQMLTGGTTTVPVTGVKASIVENGSKLRCGTSASGVFTVGTSVTEDLFMPNPNTRITQRGGNLEFSPSLPPQPTSTGPATGFIASQSCIYKGSSLEGAGFASVNLPLTTNWSIRRDPAHNEVHISCTVTTPNPLGLTAPRPKDVIGTSGGSFLFRCDLSGAARTSACQNVCNGNSQCMASCDTNAGCSPILCQGSDCPSQSCAPQNRCTVATDCGLPSRFTCTNGCCLTIIH